MRQLLLLLSFIHLYIKKAKMASTEKSHQHSLNDAPKDEGKTRAIPLCNLLCSHSKITVALTPKMLSHTCTLLRVWYRDVLFQLTRSSRQPDTNSARTEATPIPVFPLVSRPPFWGVEGPRFCAVDTVDKKGACYLNFCFNFFLRLLQQFDWFTKFFSWEIVYCLFLS